MSTSTLTTARTTRTHPSVPVPGHILAGFGRVLHSEWIKFASLRSSLILLAGTVAAMVGTGVLGAVGISTAAGMGELTWAAELSRDLPRSGLAIGQTIIGSLAVLLMASEYSTGMIRSTLTAVPARLPALFAKATVIAALSYLAGTVSALVTYLATQPILAAGGFDYRLDAPGVLGSILTTGLYLGLVAVMGVALGTLLRSSAGAIVALSALLIVAPSVLTMFPSPFIQGLIAYLPSVAGTRMVALGAAAGDLTPLQGGLVMAAWAVVLLSGAAWALKRRDV